MVSLLSSLFDEIMFDDDSVLDGLVLDASVSVVLDGVEFDGLVLSALCVELFAALLLSLASVVMVLFWFVLFDIRFLIDEMTTFNFDAIECFVACAIPSPASMVALIRDAFN